MCEEPLMQIKAAVVRERSGPFAIETVELCEPRPDEVIVRVVASGMCQTDLHGRDGYYDSPYPAVYGHEGSGVVHAVGGAVRELVPGDHVVMSYPWCGECANCQQERQNYCVRGRSLKSGGTRADSSTLLSKNGAPVYSAFFQQSSFGTFALSQERYTVAAGQRSFVRNAVPAARPHRPRRGAGRQRSARVHPKTRRPDHGRQISDRAHDQVLRFRRYQSRGAGILRRHRD
jgi:Zn-dependent alcohol dehydrogenase